MQRKKFASSCQLAFWSSPDSGSGKNEKLNHLLPESRRLLRCRNPFEKTPEVSGPDHKVGPLTSLSWGVTTHIHFSHCGGHHQRGRCALALPLNAPLLPSCNSNVKTFLFHCWFCQNSVLLVPRPGGLDPARMNLPAETNSQFMSPSCGHSSPRN